MSAKIIQERFDNYRVSSRQEAENAMAEIAQEIALAGLSRSDFFKHAAFHGGTSLRILYGMQRFSEDLDFMLNVPDRNFRLTPYLKALEIEFGAYGAHLTISDRSKEDKTVLKAFIKSDSIGKILSLKNLDLAGRMKSVRIKFEVDTNPPAGSGFETKYLDFPFPFPVTVQDMPSLFAGKSHALLCREYTKGRDWFDFVWYVGRNTPINYRFLSSAIDQVGPWQGQGISIAKEWYLSEMEKKITGVDWNGAKRDVERFLKMRDLPSVEFWGREYFIDRLKKLSENI